MTPELKKVIYKHLEIMAREKQVRFPKHGSITIKFSLADNTIPHFHIKETTNTTKEYYQEK